VTTRKKSEIANAYKALWKQIVTGRAFTTCGYKGISIETNRDALRKFYLFEEAWHGTKPEGIDWNLHPDLISFLESL
jgi:hypothetical protein